MKKTCLLSLTLSLVTLLPSALHAQATAAATRGGMSQVGVGYSNSNQDEFKDRMQGLTLYGTFDLNNHLGVEGDVHLDSLLKHSYDYTETSVDAGLRYVYHVRKFNPYAKGLVGFGHSYANAGEIVGGSTPGTYFLFALGGGVDYSLSDHINIRAIDFEYQRWPNFPPHGLTPAILTFGVAYRLR